MGVVDVLMWIAASESVFQFQRSKFGHLIFGQTLISHPYFELPITTQKHQTLIMTWDSYIDSVIGGSKQSCDKVCVIGLQDGTSWTSAAHASNLAASPEELKKIANLMKAEDYTTFQTEGIFLGDTKYRFLRSDPDEGLVLGKLKENGAITIQKSVTAVIIAHVIEGKNQGDVNGAVKVVVDYLKGLNM